MRFLAEATCYPTALLPGQGVHWQVVDARSARATLTDAAITVSLLFSFDDSGLVETVTADGARSHGRRPGRPHTVGRPLVRLPVAQRHAGADHGRGGLAAAAGAQAVLARAQDADRL